MSTIKSTYISVTEPDIQADFIVYFCIFGRKSPLPVDPFEGRGRSVSMRNRSGLTYVGAQKALAHLFLFDPVAGNDPAKIR